MSKTRFEIFMEKIDKIAEGRGGKMLTREYKNVRTKMKMQCHNGHVWEVTYNNLSVGSWCPYCINRKGLSLQSLKDMAVQNGGECLSEEYIGDRVKHRWRCAFGHEWECSPASIRAKTWCPMCPTGNSSAGERMTRHVLEEMFQCYFPKARPKWLRNMEFDGYNKEICIAFEYQGAQHYRPVDVFGGQKMLEETINKDKLKVKLSKENNVKLIVVPFFKKYHDLNFCIDRIEEAMVNCGVEIPSWVRPKEIKNLMMPISKILTNGDLAKIFDLAKTRGGKVISTELKNSKDKIILECADGHVWGATRANLVSRGQWCQKCFFKYTVRTKRGKYKKRIKPGNPDQPSLF